MKHKTIETLMNGFNSCDCEDCEGDDVDETTGDGDETSDESPAGSIPGSFLDADEPAKGETPDVLMLDEEQLEDEGAFDLEGEWEDIPVTMTADSGAGNHIINSDDIPGYMVEPSPGSIAGKGFVSANNGKILNEGQCELNLATGRNKLRSTFQVAKVNRPLMSIGKMCDQGHKVVFDAKKAEVIDKHGKVVTTFYRKGGLYTVDMMLRAPKKPKPASFHGRGASR